MDYGIFSCLNFILEFLKTFFCSLEFSKVIFILLFFEFSEITSELLLSLKFWVDFFKWSLALWFLELLKLFWSVKIFWGSTKLFLGSIKVLL